MVEDDNFGGFGPMPRMFKNWSNYAPALFGAHDVLEHGANETGGFDDEMAAQGGALFVRDFGNVYPPHPFGWSYEKILSGGLARQYEESTHEVRTPPVIYGLTSHEIEQIEEFAVGYRAGMIQDWKDYMLENYEDEDFPACPFEDDETWNRILGWVKYGFLRAKRRFDNNQWMAWTLFQKLDKLIKATPELFSETYETLTLVLDYENAHAEIRHEWE